ncbi:MAG TPA: PQQ-dependent sugar dehydrogenase [Alphaproteobacteria bacterium]|nr:PQQ-dependent sugar dehydrogenase [Alphaproteobacteria bacterium]
MATASTIVGSNAGDSISGTSANDLLYGFNPSGAQAQASAIAASRVAAGLASPLFAAAPPGDATRLFIVERGGQIEILDLATGRIQPSPFLDLSTQVATAGEQGLLGLAFDPDFATNGRFYVNLTNTSGDTEIRSYRVSPADPNHADAASMQLVLGVDQPDFTNHKGGWLGFGPDGQLYVALGDGGGGGDPLNNAQNVNSLLGKILRIDPDSDGFPADAARNYAIPADNPFVGRDGADEVWAFGLRNPWRDSFDRANGEFVIADVGQNAWEEINIGQAGANYGWRLFEGPAAFAAGTPTGGSAVPPIAFYDRGAGQSITGGYVYRGEGEALQGEYLFADFVSGRLWGLRLDGGRASTEYTGKIAADAGTIASPSSFGEDGLGNLYLTDFDGDVFRLTPQTSIADGADQIHGAAGDDFIFGGSDGDSLLGDAGNDTIHGQSGGDALGGGPGNDTLSGDTGNDRLEGGAGNDLLAGGAGQDVFEFTLGFGHDRVADFVSGQDSITLPHVLVPDLSALLTGGRQVGSDTVITADAANSITLQGVALTSLTASDFHLV